MQKYLFLFFSLATNVIFGQVNDTKRDYQWLVGYKDSSEKTVINLFNFNKSPLQIESFPIHLGILPSDAPSHICDTSGKLILYATGCDLLNNFGDVITNGQHMTPNNWVYDGYCPDYYPFIQSLLMLPDPSKDSLYYLFALGHRQGTGIHTWGMYASRFSEQEVIEKNSLVCADSIFGGHITACRHANGRDWWIVLNKTKTNGYYKYLLDPEGVHFVDLQAIGMSTTWDGSSTGQSAFSPDGARFIHYDNVIDMYLYDFDRCSGQLSNFHHVNIEHNEDTGNSFGGMAISPNSRFAYTFGYLYAYQIDLQAADLQASVTQVAYWDSTYVGPFKTTFGKAALAPDGKIYAAVPGGNPYLHTIHNPNAKGDSCQFEQHALFLPYSWNVNTMPNFPNFRLGRLPGSACDTVYTAVKEVVSEQEIKVIPNPSNGTFQILFPTTSAIDWQVEIFDLDGRSRWISKGSISNVQVSGLASGVYFLACTNTQDGRRVTQRLIVHH